VNEGCACSSDLVHALQQRGYDEVSASKHTCPSTASVTVCRSSASAARQVSTQCVHAGARDERRRSLHHRELHPGQRLRSERRGPCAVPLTGVGSCRLHHANSAVAMLRGVLVILLLW